MNKILLFYHTIIHLTARQIFYRVYYFFVTPNLFFVRSNIRTSWNRNLSFSGYLFAQQSLFLDNTACFLNKRSCISSTGSWNEKSKEKLWLYNLHYLDDLNSVNSYNRVLWHKGFILRWIKENPTGEGNGWEPYTLSLRLVNIVKWLHRNNIHNQKILNSLFGQANYLMHRLEYHIAANHLLANAKALIFVGLFLEEEQGRHFFNKGLGIIKVQIREQFLDDGGHFELSPMYHGIVLWDILELIDLVGKVNRDDLTLEIELWRKISYKAIMWLSCMSHPDGKISFFNDAVHNIAPRLQIIKKYAASLGVETALNLDSNVISMPNSGFTRLSLEPDNVVLINHADIGPKYQPGHAHADTLSFEMSLCNCRVFVNTGISRYEPGHDRDIQRSTISHNTLNINKKNSSEVWGGFRVARRANIVKCNIYENEDCLVVEAAHDGYVKIKPGLLHHRSWELKHNNLLISDRIGNFDLESVFVHYHLHPDVVVIDISSNKALLKLPTDRLIKIKLSGGVMKQQPYNYYPEFGIKIASQFLEVMLIGEELKFEISW